MKKHLNYLIQRDNCHPMKGFISVWFQVPFWICLSVSLRNFATQRPPGYLPSLTAFKQMETESLLWLNNLTLPDPYLLLPAIFVTSSLLMIQVNNF